MTIKTAGFYRPEPSLEASLRTVYCTVVLLLCVSGCAPTIVLPAPESIEWTELTVTPDDSATVRIAMPGTAERAPVCEPEALLGDRVQLCNVSFGESPHLYGTFVAYNVYYRGVDQKTESTPVKNGYGVEWVLGSTAADSDARVAHATARLENQQQLVIIASSTRKIPLEYLQGLVSEGTAKSRLDR